MPRTALSKWYDGKLERSVAESGDKVTVVSEGLKKDLSRYKSNITVIYNGYDETDMQKNIGDISTEKFTLGHIGNLIPDYNCPSFWQSIKELEKEILGFIAKFQLNFTGAVDQEAIKSLQKEDLISLTKVSPYVPHKEATLLMQTTNLLLFILPRDG